jgi:hypothetical protein
MDFPGIIGPLPPSGQDDTAIRVWRAFHLAGMVLFVDTNKTLSCYPKSKLTPELRDRASRFYYQLRNLVVTLAL